LRIYVGDARRFVYATPRRYDVIIADLFHPARDGAGALYTREHFAAVKQRLEPGGVFCQWLPLYQMDLSVLRIVVRTFLSAFPGASAWLCHGSTDSPIIGLIGGGPGTYPADWYAERVRTADLKRALARVNLGDAFKLFGCLVAGAGDLAMFAGDGPLNTDDRALVIYEAPRFIYRQDEPAAERLFALLEACAPAATDILAGDAHAGRRLTAYWQARDTFLRGLALFPREESRSHLMASLHQSPDFADAYVFLLQRVIPQEYERNPSAAIPRLREMAAAHPQRPQALRLLRKLNGAQ
jgi:spermidine synthase